MHLRTRDYVDRDSDVFSCRLRGQRPSQDLGVSSRTRSGEKEVDDRRGYLGATCPLIGGLRVHAPQKRFGHT